MGLARRSQSEPRLLCRADPVKVNHRPLSTRVGVLLQARAMRCDARTRSKNEKVSRMARYPEIHLGPGCL